MRFQRDFVSVNQIRCAVLSAGSGTPLLFLHGGGTWHGFDFALPWAATHRVLIPLHPGWGDSGDDPAMTSIQDYVLHYLEFLDQLGLPEVDLVGFSMGGRIAAQFAAQHRSRVRRLVLVAPAGLNAPGHPLADLSKVPPDQILGYLTENPARILAQATQAPDPREGESFGRLLPDLLDRKFARWLHRLNQPSMLVWGEKDRITPLQQAEEWLRDAPGLQLHRIPNAGHLVLDEIPQAVEAIGNFLIRPEAGCGSPT